jgi:hypothetical protein
MSNGWIRLHRGIEDWKFYFREPFTYASAWIDLLLLASHKESCFSLRGNLITVKRGELAWSEESLAKRWKWSRGKLRRYLTMLKTVQQIEQQKSFILNRIIILNYNQYQENDTADSTAERQQTVQQKDTYNNDKNEKNVKKEKEPTPLVRFEKPKPEQVREYALSIGYSSLNPQAFCNHYDSCGWVVGKNKPMRDWQAAVRTWKDRDNPKSTPKEKPCGFK